MGPCPAHRSMGILSLKRVITLVSHTEHLTTCVCTVPGMWVSDYFNCITLILHNFIPPTILVTFYFILLQNKAKAKALGQEAEPHSRDCFAFLHHFNGLNIPIVSYSFSVYSFLRGQSMIRLSLPQQRRPTWRFTAI